MFRIRPDLDPQQCVPAMLLIYKNSIILFSEGDEAEGLVEGGIRIPPYCHLQ
jgi:hypothetical protein